MEKNSKTAPSKKIAESYNRFKEFEGKQYTGMKVGRSHSWNYDKGQWKETKMTPDEWQIHYAVTKRRKGRAPEGSGVPVGTKYHWYILAHQIVEKLNANDYSTDMTGVKFKIAHQRASKDEWNISEKAQKKRLLHFLKDYISILESDLAATKSPATPSPTKLSKLSKTLKAKNEPLITHHPRQRTRR